MTVIETERLILRTWKEEDVEPYYLINQDPKVIEFLPKAMTKKEAKWFMSEMNQQFVDRNHTFWAVEEKETQALIGFVGLNKPFWKSHFTPCVEIGWRLGSEHWGKGYATEGAKASLEYGWNTLGLTEIVSFTVPANSRSIRVMKRIGMQRDKGGDFAHPKLPEDHPLSMHVLYRIQNPKIEPVL